MWKKLTEQEILCLDVVVDVALSVDVFQGIQDLDRDGVSCFRWELLFACLEDFLKVFSEPLHDEKTVLVALEGVTARAAVNWHSQ